MDKKLLNALDASTTKLKGEDFLRDTVEDAVQDTALHFLLSPPEIDGIKNLNGYVYKAVRNRILDIIKGERKGRDAAERLLRGDVAPASVSGILSGRSKRAKKLLPGK